MEEIVYIGQRISTKNKLAYFFKYPNGEEKGRVKLTVKFAIGEIIGLDENKQFIPTGKQDTDENIVIYTTAHLKSLNYYKLTKRKAPNLLSTEIKSLADKIVSLNIKPYEKIKLAEVFYDYVKTNTLDKLYHKG